MRSPTQNSLKLLRDEGYVAFVTEYWDGFAHKRKDLFGFGDILALKRGEVVVVQTTSDSNMSARRNKITNHENTPHVREAGLRIELHGWKKVKNRWQVRREDLS